MFSVLSGTVSESSLGQRFLSPVLPRYQPVFRFIGVLQWSLLLLYSWKLCSSDRVGWFGVRFILYYSPHLAISCKKNACGNRPWKSVLDLSERKELSFNERSAQLENYRGSYWLILGFIPLVLHSLQILVSLVAGFWHPCYECLAWTRRPGDIVRKC